MTYFDSSTACATVLMTSAIPAEVNGSTSIGVVIGPVGAGEEVGSIDGARVPVPSGETVAADGEAVAAAASVAAGAPVAAGATVAALLHAPMTTTTAKVAIVLTRAMPDPGERGEIDIWENLRSAGRHLRHRTLESGWPSPGTLRPGQPMSGACAPAPPPVNRMLR